MVKEKAAPGSKREWGMTDYCMIVCGVMGALPLFASLIPQVYWRWMDPNPNFGMRFSVGRAMSPLTVGNNGGSPIMWGRLSRAMCMKMDEYNKPDIGSAIIGFAAAAVPKAAPLAGCSAWQSCKEAVYQRCTAYRSLHIVGICCMVFIFIGACCGLCGGMLVSNEESKAIPAIKKMKSSARDKYFEKEKVQRARTFMVAASAFIFSFLGVVGWIAYSTSALNSLKSRSYYPMMYLNGPGAVCGLIGVLCMLFSAIGGFLRNKPTELPEKNDNADEEPTNNYAAAAGPQGPQGQQVPLMAPPPPPPPPPF